MFEWKDEYCIDRGIVDQEHQRLFKLANNVVAVHDPKAQFDDLSDAVAALFDYMEYHFEHEEKMMRGIGYPDIEEHVRLHKQILDTMYTTLHAQRDVTKYVCRLRHIMLDWVLQHILNEDTKAGKYARERERSEAEAVGGGSGSGP